MPHFGMCEIYVRPILRFLKGMSFSQMSNFRCVKNSHVFVTPVKNSFDFFTCLMCEFFTRVTDSFECEICRPTRIGFGTCTTIQ